MGSEYLRLKSSLALKELRDLRHLKSEHSQWAKSPKKQSKRTPSDCFFGNFSHWVKVN